mgnify:FL=1|tara:strand:- start:444 stop:830 length:387 start_codon:yes stop_codon:yes gene_type:complete
MSYDLFKDYVPAISHNKKKLMDTEDEHWEKNYNAYLINRNFSNYQDTILYANEMNIHNTADKKLQFDYLLNSVRSRKRFSPWHKKTVHNDFDIVKEYYGYNNKKTEEALTILSDNDLDIIRSKLNKGG